VKNKQCVSSPEVAFRLSAEMGHLFLAMWFSEEEKTAKVFALYNTRCVAP